MKQHKPAAVTNQTAISVLRRHFGKKPNLIKRIHGGVTNHVFEARIGREELILRISQKPSKLQSFMKEQWAVNAARRSQVPTPEILEVSNDVMGLPYMISRKVNGHPAATVAGKESAVLHELGRYAAMINRISTRDFGHIFDWSRNKLSRNRTWPEYLENELKVDQRIETLKRSGIVASTVLRNLSRNVARMRKWKGNATLCHGDLRMKNLILDDKGKIIAIIDWEECTSQIAPWWELSIALHDLSMDEKQVFLEGYGLDLKDFIDLAPGMKTLNLLNYAAPVRHALHNKDKKWLSVLQARLNGAFDLYSL